MQKHFLRLRGQQKCFTWPAKRNNIYIKKQDCGVGRQRRSWWGVGWGKQLWAGGAIKKLKLSVMRMGKAAHEGQSNTDLGGRYLAGEKRTRERGGCTRLAWLTIKKKISLEEWMVEGSTAANQKDGKEALFQGRDKHKKRKAKTNEKQWTGCKHTVSSWWAHNKCFATSQLTPPGRRNLNIGYPHMHMYVYAK